MTKPLMALTVIAVLLVTGVGMVVSRFIAWAQARPAPRLAGSAESEKVRSPGDEPAYGVQLVDGTFVLLRDVEGKLSISHWIPGLVDQQIKTNSSTIFEGDRKAVLALIPFSLWLLEEKQAVPVVAYGGKVISGVHRVRLSFDDGTRSDPLPVRGEYFIFVADAKPAGDDGAQIGPNVTELVALDAAGNEIFSRTAEQLK